MKEDDHIIFLKIIYNHNRLALLRQDQGHITENILRTFSGLAYAFLKTLSVLLHDFPMTFSGISQYFLKQSQEFLETFWGLSKDFIKTFSGLSQDFLRTFLWLSQDFLRTSKGLFRTLSGLSQYFSRTLTGLSQEFNWDFLAFLGLFQDFLMTNAACMLCLEIVSPQGPSPPHLLLPPNYILYRLFFSGGVVCFLLIRLLSKVWNKFLKF